jgi:hypothetical protein
MHTRKAGSVGLSPTKTPPQGLGSGWKEPGARRNRPTRGSCDYSFARDFNVGPALVLHQRGLIICISRLVVNCHFAIMASSGVRSSILR